MFVYEKPERILKTITRVSTKRVVQKTWRWGTVWVLASIQDLRLKPVPWTIVFYIRQLVLWNFTACLSFSFIKPGILNHFMIDFLLPLLSSFLGAQLVLGSKSAFDDFFYFSFLQFVLKLSPRLPFSLEPFLLFNYQAMITRIFFSLWVPII